MTPFNIVFLMFFCLSFGQKFCTYKGYDNFDYLVLTQTWPSTLCLHQNETCQENLVNPYFVIDEFKPFELNKVDFTGPECCKSKQRFNMFQMSQLFDLGLYWTDISGESNFILREKWFKHGTCVVKSLPKFTLEKYFSTTLQLYKKTNLLKTLLAGKVFPNNSKMLNGTRVQEILFQVISSFS